MISANERYLITFGGTSCDEHYQIDNIYVLDLEDMVFKMSIRKCPKGSNYHAIAVGDRNKGDVITFGYIRDLWSLEEMKELKHKFPPNGLIKMIIMFYSMEMVYLLAQDGTHWKISMDKILNELTEIIAD